MTLRTSSARRGCARRIGFALVALFPASTEFATFDSAPFNGIRFLSRPYLSVSPPPPLRFEDPLPPPPPVPAHPPADAPSHAASAPDESSASASPANPAPTSAPPAKSKTAPHTAPKKSPPAAESASPDAPEPPDAPESPAPSAPATPTTPRAPASILPDDTRPKVRAEDFLPFFQFPGMSPAEVAPPPAPPASLPLSTATYRQQ